MNARALPIFLCFFLMGLVDAMGPLAGTIQKQYALSGFMAGMLPACAFVAFLVFGVPGAYLPLLSLRSGSQEQLKEA